MLESESQPPSEISLLLTEDDEIRTLNQNFRGSDAATDVLSFPSSRALPFLGDIAISVQQAELQASHHNTSLDVELCCLAVHGGLHLLGYDHQTPRDEERMHEKMNEIVKALELTPAKEWASLPH